MLVRLEDEDLKKAGIPFKKGTLYVWHSQKRFPELFVKVGKKVFISKENWDKFEQKLVKESEKKAKQIEKLSAYSNKNNSKATTKVKKIKKIGV